MTEHTKLPWSVGRSETNGIVWIDAVEATSAGIADLYHRSVSDLVAKENAEANAAYIVKACNAYPELRKLLSRARYILANNELDGDESAGDLAREIDSALSSPKETE